MNEKISTAAVLEFCLLLASAAAFAAGGLCMKLSEGLERPLPTAGVFVLFCLGAALQAMGMRNTGLGTTYIFVLGAEAIFTVLLSVCVLRENYSPGRIAAVVLVVIGIAWLRAT